MLSDRVDVASDRYPSTDVVDVAVIAEDDVVALVAGNDVVQLAAEEDVVAGVALDRVGAADIFDRGLDARRRTPVVSMLRMPVAWAMTPWSPRMMSAPASPYSWSAPGVCVVGTVNIAPTAASFAANRLIWSWAKSSRFTLNEESP